MATKFKITIALVFIYVCTIFSTCRKGGGLLGGCPNSLYSFSIQAKAYPDKDSIHTGDTLWIEMNSPTLLKDNITGDMIDFKNAVNLGFVINFFKFKDSVLPAVNNLNLLLQEGSIVDRSDKKDLLREYLFKEDGVYKFKLQITPKDTGRYGISISNVANVSRKDKLCPTAGFSIDFSATNSHIYLLKQWQPGVTLNDVNTSKVYYFKVY